MPQAAILPFVLGGLLGGAAITGVSALNAQKKAAKQAAAEQAKAQAAQMRASRAAEEDAQLQASEGQSAAARISRAAGRRILAFQGVETGTPTPAATLGG